MFSKDQSVKVTGLSNITKAGVLTQTAPHKMSYIHLVVTMITWCDSSLLLHTTNSLQSIAFVHVLNIGSPETFSSLFQ